MFFQNFSESLMKMMSDKMIDPKLHLDSQDNEIQEYVQKDLQESCKKFDNEEAKIIFLNNVHYELAINFKLNQWKEVHDRVEDLLSEWANHLGLLGHGSNNPLYEPSYLKKNSFDMVQKMRWFTTDTNREDISIIEALIGKEHINQFNLGSLFDQIKTLVEKTIPEEEANLWKAKQEEMTKEFQNDIAVFKKNSKCFADEKRQKAVAIIRKINEFGEKVEVLTSKINVKIQEQLIKLSSTIYEQYNIGPELWEQTEESCSQLKPKQIKMKQKEEAIVFEEALADLQFELDEKRRSIARGWKGIKEYYLSIPLMQLTEQARTLAKTFRKMLQNMYELYAAKKMDESNVGEDVIISE